MEQDLHGLAVQAEGAVEKLATGLGEAGAPPETVQGITQIAEVLRSVVQALGEPLPEEGAPVEGAPVEEAPPAPAPEGPSSIGGAVDESF